jgi:hypothetical protein
MLEHRVAALVGEHQAELEELIDRELDAVLDRLIDERIRARNRKPSPALCTVCGERERAAIEPSAHAALERGKRERRAARAAAEGEGAVPFRCVGVGELARGHPRCVVRAVVNDGLRLGRLETDGKGRVRLRIGAFPAELVAALGGLDR